MNLKRLFSKASVPDPANVAGYKEITQLRDQIRLLTLKNEQVRRAIEIHHEAIAACDANIKTLARSN